MTTELSDHTLLLCLVSARRRADEAAIEIHTVEQEILRRMAERGARAMFGDGLSVEIETRDTYEQAGFTPLLELLPPEALVECYTPEHQQLVTAPAKWNTQQVLKWARKVGASALAVTGRARVPGRPRIGAVKENQT